MKRISMPRLAVTLSACGASTTDQASVTSQTVVASPTAITTTPPAQRAPSSERATATASTSIQPAMASTSQPTSTTEEIVAQLQKNPHYGDPYTINGETTELCINGDGYAMHVVTAAPNTSCKFATSLMEAQTKGLNATYDNVRDHLKSPIEVVSPVTQQSYTMHCQAAPSKLITCTGGNNAKVYMF